MGCKGTKKRDMSLVLFKKKQEQLKF